MKFLLLTVALFAASAAAASVKVKRDILPGDPRYGTEYHLQHHHAHHGEELKNYLPPNADLKNYLPPNKESLELPSTSYGVPFKSAPAPAQVVVSKPVVQSPVPIVKHVIQQVHESTQVASVAAPHKVYGAPVRQVVQPAPIHVQQPSAPVAPAAPAAPAAPVHVYQPAPVYSAAPVQSQQVVQPAPAQTVYQQAPVHQYVAGTQKSESGYHYHQATQVHQAPAQTHVHQAPQVHQVQAAAPAPQIQYIPAPAPQVSQVQAPAPQIQYIAAPAPQVNHVQYVAPAPAQPQQHVYQQAAPAPAHVYQQAAPAQAQVYQQAAPAQAQVYQQAAPAPAHVYQQAAPAQAQVYQQAAPAPAQTQVYHQAPTQIFQQEKLVFDAPVQSIEVSHQHTSEIISAPAPAHNDAVSVESSRATGNSYSQATDANGGYLY